MDSISLVQLAVRLELAGYGRPGGAAAQCRGRAGAAVRVATLQQAVQAGPGPGDTCGVGVAASRATPRWARPVTLARTGRALATVGSAGLVVVRVSGGPARLPARTAATPPR